MKTKIEDKGNQIILLSTEKTFFQQNIVLAVLNEHRDKSLKKSFWMLNDVRLTKGFDVFDYWVKVENRFSYYTPQNKKEFAYITSKLREYHENTDGCILWSPFNGVVRGHSTVDGYAPKRLSDFDGGYFSREEGLSKLIEIQNFWDNLPNLNKLKEEDWRIPNPHAQPLMSDMHSLCSMRKNFLLTGKITQEEFKEIEQNTLNYCLYLQERSSLLNSEVTDFEDEDYQSTSPEIHS